MFSEPAKQPHWRQPFISLTGILLCTASLVLLVRLFQAIFALNIIYQILLIIVYTFLASIGATMFLFVFPSSATVKKISRITLFPAEVIAKVGYCYNSFTAPIYIFLFSIIFPFSFWFAAYQLAGAIEISGKVIYYSTFTFALVFFVYLGRFMTVSFLKLHVLGNKERDISKSYLFMHRDKLRILAYTILAVIYIWFNIERFAGISFFLLPFWGDYKEIILEVLLTFSVVDFILEKRFPESKVAS